MLLGVACNVGNTGDPGLVVDTVCAASENTSQRAQILHRIVDRLRMRARHDGEQQYHDVRAGKIDS